MAMTDWPYLSTCDSIFKKQMDKNLPLLELLSSIDRMLQNARLKVVKKSVHRCPKLIPLHFLVFDSEFMHDQALALCVKVIIYTENVILQDDLPSWRSR